MNQNAPVIVFGEGSSSVFLIHELIKKNENVIWVGGSGTPLLPVMPHVKSALALGTLASAAESSGIGHSGVIQTGTSHLVYRSKAFKAPQWKKVQEQIWDPEFSCLSEEEFRVEGLDPVRIEETLRGMFEAHPLITKVQNAPVLEFEIFDQGGKVQFANGLITEFKQFYFCDDLSALKAFPKLGPVFKNQMKGVKSSSRYGALQVTFTHAEPLSQRITRGMVIPMNRDSGETFDRDVLGCFVEPTRSVWTVFLQPSECEENHEIMKKLRKLKQSLNRAFEGPEFLPAGKKDFMSNVEREQVRFEENALLTEGSLQASSSNPDFVLMTDSFGFSSALERIAIHFGIKAAEFEVGAPALDLETIEMPAHLVREGEIPGSQPSI